MIHRKMIAHPEPKAAIEDRLKARWSPEQIAGRMRSERHPIRLSHETIYRFASSKDSRDEPFYRHLPAFVLSLAEVKVVGCATNSALMARYRQERGAAVREWWGREACTPPPRTRKVFALLRKDQFAGARDAQNVVLVIQNDADLVALFDQVACVIDRQRSNSGGVGKLRHLVHRFASAKSWAVMVRAPKIGG